MAEHIITFPAVSLGIDDTEIQLILTFTVTGAAVSWAADEKGIFVMAYGNTSWRYDLDNPLLTPGTQDIIIHDRDEYLSNLFFTESSAESDTEKTAKVELYLNGVIEFSGNIIEDSISYNVAEKLIKFSASNSLEIMNKTALYYEQEDGSGGLEWTEYNPMGYTANNYYSLREIIRDIFQLVDSDISLTNGRLTIFSNDEYASYLTGSVSLNGATNNGTSVTCSTPSGVGASLTDGDPVLIYGVEGMTDLNKTVWTVSNVTANTFDVQLTTTQTYTSGGQFTRVGLYTGNEFVNLLTRIDPLYFDYNYGMTSCGDILRTLALELRCFAGLKTGQDAFFVQLFYYNSANVQTLGTVINWQKAYRTRLYNYVESRTVPGENETRVYKAGTDTGVTDGKLILDKTLITFFDAESGDTAITDSVEVAYSNFLYHTDAVYAMRNTIIDNYWHDSGYIQAQSWYKYRGDIVNSRIDTFEVVGVEYDFLKNFVYDGKRYQIIGLTKDWEQGKSKIEAIYLGLDS